MIQLISRNAIRFIVLLLVQIFILQNVKFELLNNAVPFVYVLFLLLLPFETPRWLLISLGFFTGIMIDIFSDSFGLHATACVFMAYLRPIVLQLIAPRDGYETGTQPQLGYFNYIWVIKYTSILIIAHHFAFFVVEAFQFKMFFEVIIKTISASLFSIVTIILTQFIFSVKKK